MPYDFDQVIERRDSGCIKFDRRPDLDPFWVADMDFASPPEVIEALHRRVDHRVFGYPQAHAGLEQAVHDYLERRHGYRAEPDQVVHLGGLVPALSLAARAFCKPGEAVLTCTPVYPPFLGVHRDAGAELITVDHALVDGRWTLDFDALEAAVTPRTRLLTFCSPQNPLGRVFDRSEVTRLAEFCARHQLVFVSDEIHCDLILDEDEQPFFSALRLPPELLERTIVLLSPSKTWNIAGLGYAYAVIPDAKLRRRFSAARGHTLAEINALSYFAAEAAYRHGEPWRQALLAYLRENRRTLHEFLAAEVPGLAPLHGAATYLAWIGARDSGVEHPARHLEEQAGLFVSDGAFFGWPGWFRFNFATPRAHLRRGLEKLAAAFQPAARP